MKNNIMEEKVLVDQAYFKELIQAIDQAKKSIDMEVYIFANDSIGKQVSDTLIASANRGIKIRLLLDGVGSYHWNHDFSEPMKNAGIQIRIYHPIFLFFSHWLPNTDFFSGFIELSKRINSRNHRKTCLIDNEIAFIGSANISEGTEVSGKLMHWHDLSIKVKGISFDELHYAFNRAWNYMSFPANVRLIWKETFLFTSNPNPILRFNYSFRKRRILYKSLLNQINTSKKRIWITNAYFVPKPFLLRKIRQALRRGVEVKILIPAVTDVIGMRILSKYCYSNLLEKGAEVFQYHDEILHVKMIIIDDWYCVGSSNLNYRSLKHDLEADLQIQTPEAKKTLENHFKYLCQKANTLSKEDATHFTFTEKIALYLLWFVRSLF